MDQEMNAVIFDLTFNLFIHYEFFNWLSIFSGILRHGNGINGNMLEKFDLSNEITEIASKWRWDNEKQRRKLKLELKPMFPLVSTNWKEKYQVIRLTTFDDCKKSTLLVLL